MPLSKPWPGMDRNVMALACVAITERPIVPQPMDWPPLRYVLRLRTWRVRQDPYAAMPTMVPSSTTQSAKFTRRTGKRARAVLRRARTSRTQTGRCHARCGSRAHPVAHSPRTVRVATARSLAEGNEVREQPIGAGHTFGKLAKPREARVDEISLSVPGHEKSALKGLLAGIAGGKNGREALVPLIRKVEPALLHPPGEIG